MTRNLAENAYHTKPSASIFGPEWYRLNTLLCNGSDRHAPSGLVFMLCAIRTCDYRLRIGSLDNQFYLDSSKLRNAPRAIIAVPEMTR